MGEKKVPRVRESFFFWRWGPPNVIHTDRVLTELSQVHMASVESYVWLLGKKQQVCVFIFFNFLMEIIVWKHHKDGDERKKVVYPLCF